MFFTTTPTGCVVYYEVQPHVMESQNSGPYIRQKSLFLCESPEVGSLELV